MRAWKHVATAALVTIVIGVVVPAATAATPDAVARYAAHHQAPDTIDRWLAAHPDEASVPAAPISDVESSLQAERKAVAKEATPISDVASSLQAARNAAAAAGATPGS